MKPLYRLFTAGDGFNMVIVHLQQGFGIREHTWFIVNNEDLLFPGSGMFCVHILSCVSGMGRSKAKVLPRPTSLSTQIFPPWASTKRRAIASPNPIPLDCSGCTRKNSLKISRWYSG